MSSNTMEEEGNAWAEKQAKPIWKMAMYSSLGLSLLLFFGIVTLQSKDDALGFVLFMLTLVAGPALLALNLLALLMALMECRTAPARRALRILGLFWANMGICLFLAVLYFALRS